MSNAGLLRGHGQRLSLPTANIRDFGAVGNGVACDDAAFMAARDFIIKAGGGVIYVPAGFYLSIMPWVVPSNCRLAGDGKGATVVCNVGPNTTTVIILGGFASSRVGVEGLSVCKKEYATRLAGSGSGIQVSSVTDFEITDVEAYNVPGVGIVSYSGARGRITHCYPHDTLADGIALFSNNQQVKVAHNSVYNTGDDGISCNSYTGNPENIGCSIIDNDIKNAGGCGIAILGGQRNAAIGNDIEGTFLAGIRVQALTGFTTVGSAVIRGNRIRDASSLATSGPGAGGSIVPAGHGGGIIVETDNAALGISAVDITDNFIQGGAYNFIAVGGSVGAYKTLIHIERNRCYGALTYGDVTNRSAVSSSRAGIAVDYAFTFSVKDNFVFQPLDAGIAVGDNCSGVAEIRDNWIDSPNQNAGGALPGVITIGSSTYRATGNRCTGVGANAPVPVLATGGTAVMVKDNSIDSVNVGQVRVIPLLIQAAVLPDGTGSVNAPARLDKIISSGTQTANSPKASYNRLLFAPATADEHAMWQFTLPSDYISGGTLRGLYTNVGVSANGVVWKVAVAIAVSGTTDLDAIVFNAVATATSTPDTNTGDPVEFTIAPTMTNAAAGREIIVMVGRDQDHASDTNASDMALVGLAFEYQGA